MGNPFDHTSASWVRYSQYEWKKGKDGHLYITPTKDASPKPYDPMKDAETLVMDAMDIALLCYHKKPDKQIQSAMLRFARNYGLLGLMTALPTTANFMEYDKVYLLKNQFIKKEIMETREYVSLFFPFSELDYWKEGRNSSLTLHDKTMIALMLTYKSSPQALIMSLMRDYAERYDWLIEVFKDWAFVSFASLIYYHDYDILTEDDKSLYRRAMTVFDGNAPTYHIELWEHPTLVWDFHSLMLGIQMMFTFMLTDENNPLRLCEQCQKPFIAKEPGDNCCSRECRKEYEKEHQHLDKK